MDGMQKLGGTMAEQLSDLAKRTGGIPGFAMDALRSAGVDAKDLEQADIDGKAAAAANRP